MEVRKAGNEADDTCRLGTGMPSEASKGTVDMQIYHGTAIEILRIPI